MNLFQRFSFWLKNPFTYRSRQREWADRFNQPPAQPENPLPLDNDPWRT